MKNINSKIVFNHLMKYKQYTGDIKWFRWYAKVAPLKGKRTVKILQNYKHKEAKLLDLGCGTGLTLSTLAQHFPNTIGCDVGSMEVKASKRLLKLLGIRSTVILYDGKRLPFKDRQFDIVTSIEVFEHVPRPELMLKEIRRVLKPNGILHITTANKWWPIEPHFKLPLLSYLPKKLAGRYLKITKKGVSYEDINLPSYTEFYNTVNKYFKIQDLTLEIIRDYKKYGFDKERGWFISVLSILFNTTKYLKRFSVLAKPAETIDRVSVRLSLGWLFIAHPR